MEAFGTVAVPAITGITWIICFIVKKWIRDDDHKYIPTLALILGIILQCINVGGAPTLEQLFVGMVSGMSATGANELVKQYRSDTTVESDVE